MIKKLICWIKGHDYQDPSYVNLHTGTKILMSIPTIISCNRCNHKEIRPIYDFERDAVLKGYAIYGNEEVKEYEK